MVVVRSGIVIVLTAAALACATPPTDAEVESDLRRLSADVRGLGPSPRLVVLNAGSSMDAWSHVAESRADGPSTRARALGRRFAKGSQRRVGIVVGGPFPQLNDRMVLDALEAAGSGPLPGLTLVMVSPEPPEEQLRIAALRRRVKLVHRRLPE